MKCRRTAGRIVFLAGETRQAEGRPLDGRARRTPRRTGSTTMSGFAAATALALSALPAPAIEVEPGECREASQFIGNAARARDNGYSREKFVARFDEDIMLLSSMRPETRWFVHGEPETRFLRAAIAQVYDAPREPATHERGFLAACLDAAGRAAPG
jgi:hypothetical protein